MSLLESPHTFESPDPDEPQRSAAHDRPDETLAERALLTSMDFGIGALDLGLADVVIDLNANRVAYAPRPVADREVEADVSPAAPSGLYLRRVHLRSVAKLAAVFFGVGFIAAVGSALVLWAIATQLGVVASFERLVSNSLGVEQFEVAGASVIGVVAVVAAVASGLGMVATMLAAAIYNLTGSLFGGLAFETNPIDAQPVAAAA